MDIPFHKMKIRICAGTFKGEEGIVKDYRPEDKSFEISLQNHPNLKVRWQQGEFILINK